MVGRIVKRSEWTIVERLDELQQVQVSRLDTFLEDSARSLTKLEEMLLDVRTHAPFGSLEVAATGAKPTEGVSGDPLQHFGKLKSRSLPTPSGDGLNGTKTFSSISQKKSAVSSFSHFAASTRELAAQPGSQEGQGGARGGAISDLYDPTPSKSPVENCLRYIQITAFVLVVLNIVYMGISLDVSMPYAIRGEQAPAWLNHVERGFVVIFCLELVIRAVLEKHQFYKGPNRWWNLFDGVIVGFQLLEQLQIHSLRNTTFFRVFRISRIIRAARTFRTMKSMRIVRLLMCGEVWQPLLWGFALMFAMIYLFSILIATIVNDYVQLNTELPPRLLELYGSVQSTMLTLYMAISYGEPWDALMMPLEHISSAMRTIFVIYIIIIALGLQNTLAAVFVDGLTHVSSLDRDITMHERNAKEKSQLRQLRELLLCQPLTPEGKIERHALIHVLKHEGADMLKKLGLQLTVAKALFKMLDTDDQQSVEIDEFIYGLMNLKGNSMTIQLANLMYHSKQLLSRLCRLSGMVEDEVLPLLQGVDPELAVEEDEESLQMQSGNVEV